MYGNFNELKKNQNNTIVFLTLHSPYYSSLVSVFFKLEIERK